VLELALPGKLIQRESGKSICKVCRGIARALLIYPCEGTVRGYLKALEWPPIPCQRRLCPRVPGLSPEYSHKGRLQTVITVKAITNVARNALILAGPVTVGRIPHGPPGAVTTWETRRLRQRLRLATERTKGDRVGLHPINAFGLFERVLWMWPSSE
jgi:hypothetical protein